MGYMIFNMRMWSFLCMRMHMGVGHSNSKSAQHFWLWKTLTNLYCAPDGVRISGVWILFLMLYQLSQHILPARCDWNWHQHHWHCQSHPQLQGLGSCTCLVWLKQMSASVTLSSSFLITRYEGVPARCSNIRTDVCISNIIKVYLVGTPARCGCNRCLHQWHCQKTRSQLRGRQM